LQSPDRKDQQHETGPTPLKFVEPLWVFNKPVYLTDDNRPKFAKMAEGWQHKINKRAERRNLHYGVGVGNLDRLLRLPGTINRKAGVERPCRVVHTSGKVHALWG
jgi:hypothetical protein